VGRAVTDIKPDAPVEEPRACEQVADNDPWPCVLDENHPARHCDANGNTWKHGHKYGRPDLYEITWMSGHIETVAAHQVTYPHQGLALFSGGGAATLTADQLAPRVRMHAELDGRWCLTLSAREEDIRTMRLVTDAEQIPGVGR
jgi:hypothetical protein